MDAEGRIKNIILRRMSRCVVCHREFTPDDIAVVSHDHDIWTMVVECEDCHARNFVAAVLNDADAEEARGAIERLTKDAIDTFATRRGRPTGGDDHHDAGPVVDSSDVIDMHEFLDTFDGDFRALFRRDNG